MHPATKPTIERDMFKLKCARHFAIFLTIASFVAHNGYAFATSDCGRPGTIVGKDGDNKVLLKTRVFPDGSIAVQARLMVNPDGGPSSYTFHDHGFTYVANGLALWRNGEREACGIKCINDFKDAENAGFSKGTPEFCVFAMVVEPFPGRQRVTCRNGFVIGNEKGRLALSSKLESVTGDQIQPYRSATSLQHLIGNKAEYLDSEAIPIAVTPTRDLLGKIVVVGGGGESGIGGRDGVAAIIGDSGPAFGEGSIALHQLLRYGSVKAQKPGPIAADGRCQAAELSLEPPFLSKPDGRAADRCRSGYKAKTVSDIRAYEGFDEKISFVILGKASMPMKGAVIQQQITPSAIYSSIERAGYSNESIAKMRRCLEP
jgi:hypothetical protein